MKKKVFLNYFIYCCLFFSSGIVDANTANITTQKEKIELIYQQEIKYIMSVQQIRVDELWALKKISQLSNDDALKKFIDIKSSAIKHDPFLLLLDNKAKKMSLPLDSGKGSQKLFHFMMAPFGQPAKRAFGFTKEFLAYELTGYLLAHQLLVLEWAEQMGSFDTKSFSQRKKELLNKLYKEQNNDSVFSDLYAERAAILLNSKTGKRKEHEQWIDNMIESRQKTGGWSEFELKQAFDGEPALIKPGNMHTRVLVLWAMQIYLNQYFN